MSQASETESEFSCEGLTSFSEPSLPGGNSRRNLLGTITHEQVLRAIHDIDATGAQFSSSVSSRAFYPHILMTVIFRMRLQVGGH
jgi:hypothetical protein